MLRDRCSASVPFCKFRTSEKSDSGNKRGLDLKVMDNCGGSKEGRSVSTLSGGEKFLASLALSIGLAGIAKTGGVDIEGIFIDEGFGTLDEDCIGDALDILVVIDDPEFVAEAVLVSNEIILRNV